MKKYYFLLLVLMMSSSLFIQAQKKWSDLSKEEKQMKLQAFRDDNQKYLKETLKLTDEQCTDIDNVNLCFLSTLDRIDRYGKSDADKEKYVKTIADGRSAQLDAIMGPEKRKQFQAYVKGKLDKATAATGK